MLLESNNWETSTWTMNLLYRVFLNKNATEKLSKKELPPGTQIMGLDHQVA
jgi:hypothetical protein